MDFTFNSILHGYLKSSYNLIVISNPWQPFGKILYSSETYLPNDSLPASACFLENDLLQREKCKRSASNFLNCASTPLCFSDTTSVWWWWWPWRYFLLKHFNSYSLAFTKKSIFSPWLTLHLLYHHSFKKAKKQTKKKTLSLMLQSGLCFNAQKLLCFWTSSFDIFSPLCAKHDSSAFTASLIPNYFLDFNLSDS